MPKQLVHCRSCRALLNADLESDSVEIPAFVPLQEIDSCVEVAPRGFYISCPLCDRELKINGRYVGRTVECISCNQSFQFSFTDPKIEKTGFYCDCPHCTKRLRLATNLAGKKVARKYCLGRVRIVEDAKP